MTNKQEQFTFFWKSQSPFSNWYLSDFTLDGITFNCNEQYMMYQKALLFNDQEIADKILKTKSPTRHKQLGRKVKNFDDKIWNKNCQNIVYTGLKAKFSQNDELLKKLKETDGTTLVEASPYDKIWGIGMKMTDKRAQNRSTWLGKNLLGELLTKVREDL